MKKKIFWIFILSLVLASAVYFYFRSKKSKAEYTTVQVERGDLKRSVSVTGEVIPRKKADLNFKTSGKIESIGVSVGDKVSAGQILASLNKDVLMVQYRAALADIHAQEETLANMKDDRDTFSKDQRDAQRAVIEKYKAAADVILEQIKEADIVSPMDGIVISKNYEKGEIATATTSVLTVASENDLLLESNIPESDISKIMIGQKAEVVFDAFSQHETFEARVAEIEPASTVIQDVIYYKIKLEMENNPGIKVGMSADIDVKTAENKNVIMIPIRAIKTEGKKKFVDAVGADSLLEKLEVETGLEGDNGMVEIRSGLQQGQSIVTFIKN